MKYSKLIVSLCLSFFGMTVMAQRPALIPQPVKVEWGTGEFVLPKGATISCESAQLRPAADYLQQMMGRATGYKLSRKKSRGTIQLALSAVGKKGSYTLRVHKNGVRIEGNTYQGVINGIATLRQLFAREIESPAIVADKRWTLPYVSITDEPRFDWRGMHFDCSRHFFTKAEVEALLDVLALYKIDKFHWHLTDDQGWRVEIKKYPLLTDNGAWRTFNNQDSTCMARAKAEDNPELEIQPSKIRRTAAGEQQYGGYYTQQDIREIVDYAAVRGIEIIPEIDMPGHSLAAIANYDGISCFKKTGWGKLFTTPMCPGKDKMLDFCKDVWREVFGLFPSKYVHIGGDEADMKYWKECPDCQKRMKENGLTTEPQLQTWFNNYMEQFFNANGKEMLAWDDVIEGGLTPTSTIMWWRSWKPLAPKQATSHGNRFICAPNKEFYIDYEEDKNSIPKIYAFNPLGGGLTDAEKGLVLGVQGCLWTEWVPTFERMWYQAFPRMIAVAELGWSRPEVMNLQDFQHRLAGHYDRLHLLGVNYRTPDLTGFYNTNVFTDRGEVNLQCQDPSAVIRYTTDGSIPQADSKLYTGPFAVTEPIDFTFRTFTKEGRKGDFVKASWIREDFAPSVSMPSVKPGLKAAWYDYDGADCAGIDKVKLNGYYDAPEVSIPQEASGNIGLIITGYVEVPADGIYTFALLSDDGSYLKVDGKMVVDNDGEHSAREIIGQHAMKRGLHPLYVRYFDHNGGQLRLRVLDKNGQEVKVNYFTEK